MENAVFASLRSRTSRSVMWSISDRKQVCAKSRADPSKCQGTTGSRMIGGIFCFAASSATADTKGTSSHCRTRACEQRGRRTSSPGRSRCLSIPPAKNRPISLAFAKNTLLPSTGTRAETPLGGHLAWTASNWRSFVEIICASYKPCAGSAIATGLRETGAKLRSCSRSSPAKKGSGRPW